MQPFLDRFTGGKTLGEGRGPPLSNQLDLISDVNAETGLLFSIYNIVSIGFQLTYVDDSCQAGRLPSFVSGSSSCVRCYPLHFSRFPHGFSSDKYGRRSGMFWGGIYISIASPSGPSDVYKPFVGVIICLGTAIISASARVPQFLLGRFILGFGVSFLKCAAPSYVLSDLISGCH